MYFLDVFFWMYFLGFIFSILKYILKYKMLTTQSLYVALLLSIIFFVVSAPFTYKLINNITSSFNLVICDSNGLPNEIGMLIHTIIFGLLVYIICIFVPVPKL